MKLWLKDVTDFWGQDKGALVFVIVMLAAAAAILWFR